MFKKYNIRHKYVIVYIGIATENEITGNWYVEANSGEFKILIEPIEKY